MNKILSLCFVLFCATAMADLATEDDYKNKVSLVKALFGKDLSLENTTGASNLERLAKEYKKFLKKDHGNSQYNKKFKKELARVQEWLEEKTISNDKDLWFNRLNPVYAQKTSTGTKYMYDRRFKGEDSDEHYTLLITFELSESHKISNIRFTGSFREDN